jgi:hypothetical protein
VRGREVVPEGQNRKHVPRFSRSRRPPYRSGSGHRHFFDKSRKERETRPIDVELIRPNYKKRMFGDSLTGNEHQRK